MNVLHPWHGISFGVDAPNKVNAIIEISQGSRCKYEIDKNSGLLKLDRIIYSSFHYPINYGFIPQTLGEDKDPLDILVLCSESIQPLCMVEATIIGNMQMVDNEDIDDKIISIASNDPSFNHIHDIQDLPSHFMEQLQNFFEQYKVLEKKKVAIEAFQNKEAAYKIIHAATLRYKEYFQREKI